MAGKRTASSDLNHDNWDRDDEPEEAGVFKRASEDQLKGRVMKTARRRKPISSVREEGGNSGVFAGFTAFTKTQTPPTSNVFAFLSNITSQSEQSKTNGFGEKTKLTPTPSVASSPKPSTVTEDKKSQDYYSKLKGLNESVSKWIKNHVDANPLVDLRPIFKDYEKYFKDIENEKESSEKRETPGDRFVMKTPENVPDSTTEKTQQDNGKGESRKGAPDYSFLGSSAASTAPVTSVPTFSFGSKTSAASNQFSFGSAASTNTAPNTFSFGSTSSTISNISSFSSSSTSAPFMLSAMKPTSSENKEGNDGEEEEDAMPLEPQLAKVVESDHIYTVRCKVFKKKDNKYVACGVGDLYVKPIEGSQKMQVIVRADNNLGTLICNFVLSANIPTQKLGAKDVMLVCLITPDAKPPPSPILIRVKSSEEADRLLEVLEKHKK